MTTTTDVLELTDVKQFSVITAEDIFLQIPPEIEDAAFQALALENAESWL